MQRRGREVRLTFAMSSLDKAKVLQDDLQHQIRTGVIFLALTGDAEAPK